MSNRHYSRDEIKWDIHALQELAKLDPPQATYFEKADRWVVKQDGKSFAVKPSQIVDDGQEDGVYDDGAYEAEMAHERWLEDGGPHAAAIAAEDDYERQREANDPGLQQLRTAETLDDQLDDLLAHFTKKGEK